MRRPKRRAGSVIVFSHFVRHQTVVSRLSTSHDGIRLHSRSRSRNHNRSHSHSRGRSFPCRHSLKIQCCLQLCGCQPGLHQALTIGPLRAPMLALKEGACMHQGMRGASTHDQAALLKVAATAGMTHPITTTTIHFTRRAMDDRTQHLSHLKDQAAVQGSTLRTTLLFNQCCCHFNAQVCLSVLSRFHGKSCNHFCGFVKQELLVRLTSTANLEHQQSSGLAS